MPEVIKIKEHEVGLGEQKIIRLEIARLPSGMMIEMPIHVYRSKTDGPVLLLLPVILAKRSSSCRPIR